MHICHLQASGRRGTGRGGPCVCVCALHRQAIPIAQCLNGYLSTGRAPPCPPALLPSQYQSSAACGKRWATSPPLPRWTMADPNPQRPTSP
ncbi:hypothetical protein CALVIDRAFT_138267 [Calocera viscosa TUFC12733]|uniref:Uncharacterized protein n=1 Tax=Calocera viscosa (strain TUFC12733) TaxID=1330018 RepID=A0A167M009_CALVF|nr:hypothetical protein CALVIDRAFT_138267 [Calocera viscosa TUFC12733]